MTEIHYIDDHGFWRREYGITGQIEIMHHMLKNHPLEPSFLEYGGFHKKDPLNTREEPLYTPGTTLFSGNFYDASCVFRFASDQPEIVEPMVKAIEDNIASDPFIAAKQARAKNLQDIREARERREKQRLAEARRMAILTMTNTSNMTREQAIELCGLAAVEAVEAKSADYAQGQGSAADGHYFTAGVNLPESEDYYTLTVHYAPVADEDMPADGDLGSIDWKISHYSVV